MGDQARPGPVSGSPGSSSAGKTLQTGWKRATWVSKLSQKSNPTGDLAHRFRSLPCKRKDLNSIPSTSPKNLTLKRFTLVNCAT